MSAAAKELLVLSTMEPRSSERGELWRSLASDIQEDTGERFSEMGQNSVRAPRLRKINLKLKLKRRVYSYLTGVEDNG